MKYGLFLLWIFSSFVNSSTSHFQIPAKYGGEDDLDAWHYSSQAFVPITIKHIGKTTPYYIEVNNEKMSDVFQMEGEESVSIDVPVTLEKKHGAQYFRVCSVAFHGDVGSRICTKAELFLIEAL